MTTGRQRRARRAKKQRAQARARQEHARSDAAAGPVEAIMGAFDRFAGYIRGASSFEEAAAAARADLRRGLDDLVVQARGHGVLRVVQSVRTGMVVARAVYGVEPSAAVLELIALTLVCRDAAGAVAPARDPDAEFYPPNVQVAAQAALDAGAMIALFDSPPTDALSQVVYHSTQREVMLRNPVYPHMLLDTLRGLFNDPDVGADCRTVLGFSGIEAVNVLEAVRMLSAKELARRFERMETVRVASMPLITAWARERRRDAPELPSRGADLDPEHQAVAEEIYAAIQDLTTYVDQSAVIDLQAVADESSLPLDTVAAVIDTFTLRGPRDVDEVMDRFFRGDNPLRTAPIVADADGRRMLVHDGLALPAVREVLETKLKEAGRTSAYEHHRGQWVENAAIDLLVGVLPGAEVHRSFNYFVPDPTAVVPQTDPSKFTKRVEADGLILIDDVAFIVEVKSVALTAEARGGVARRLHGKLRDIVTAAASQADRLRQRIVTDKRIRCDHDKWIDVSNVREIHTIAVGLEDLSGVSTATAMLVGAGVLTPDHIPWTVSLHDLRIICELLDRPSELLLYLRRRTHPHATTKYLAVDELDLYLLFLNRGMYVEPNPDEVAEALPWSGEPTVAARRRYERQQREIVESQTEPLDAWYEAQLDPSHLPADKPALPGDAALLKLIDDITASKQPGWLSTTTMLLEGNTRAQRAFGRYARDLARRVKQDGQHHSATHILTDTAGTPFVLVWACCGRDETADAASSYLAPYLSAKKHQVGAPRAALMLFDSRGTQFLRLLFDNREPGPDPDLDRDASQLVPLESMKATPPRPARPRSKPRKRKK